MRTPPPGWQGRSKKCSCGEDYVDGLFSLTADTSSARGIYSTALKAAALYAPTPMTRPRELPDRIEVVAYYVCLALDPHVYPYADFPGD